MTPIIAFARINSFCEFGTLILVSISFSAGVFLIRSFSAAKNICAAATALREFVGSNSSVAADFANSESMSATSLSFSASLKVSTLTPGK